MTEPVFSADPLRLLIAAAVGIILLLVLIIKFKSHPVISMMIAAIVIGVGAGMPLNLIGETVEKGVGSMGQDHRKQDLHTASCKCCGGKR